MKQKDPLSFPSLFVFVSSLTDSTNTDSSELLCTGDIWCIHQDWHSSLSQQGPCKSFQNCPKGIKCVGKGPNKGRELRVWRKSIRWRYRRTVFQSDIYCYRGFPLPYLWPPSLTEMNFWKKKLLLHLDKYFRDRHLDLLDRKNTILLAIKVLQIIPRAPCTRGQLVTYQVSDQWCYLGWISESIDSINLIN